MSKGRGPFSELIPACLKLRQRQQYNMTSKERYKWEAVIVVLAIWPTLFSTCQFPHLMFAFLGCLAAFYYAANL